MLAHACLSKSCLQGLVTLWLVIKVSFRAQKATFISCVKSSLGILNVSSLGLGGVILTKIKQVKLLAPTLFEVTALHFLLVLYMKYLLSICS